MDNLAFIENLRQLFAECDVDNNGCLGRDEFSELCAKIGLNKEAAHETFARLDIDKDDRITFDEFAAGFNQYKSSSAAAAAAAAGPSSQPHLRPKGNDLQQVNKKPPSPASTLGRKSASPVGVMMLGGSASASGTSSSSNNLPGLSLNLDHKTTSSGGGGSADVSDLGAGSSSFDTAASSGLFGANLSAAGADQRADDSMIVYSNESVGQDYDQAPSSGQFGSLLGGGGGSINGSGNFSQVRNMQELLDCVQKLQSENQILTQIFFKDKREREEYISQLGEEFDQQVREVEERANRRAREELESEKKRLREMMQTERETLQHHYKTIEKMSKLIQTPQSSRSSNDLLLDGQNLDKVKSKLEDTYLENRQLKRSLLDTKTDVAMIWREMEKLKRQYEDKLSSAYQKNDETRNECDHIKQQLSLMKDSNRKLQDASDVITTYIADKVEPVIKGAASAADDPQYLSPNGCHSLTGSLRLAQVGGSGSQSNSRRGSVLSEYLNSHPASTDDDDDDDDEDDDNGDDEDEEGDPGQPRATGNLEKGARQQKSQGKRATTGGNRWDRDYPDYDAPSLTASSMSSSGGGNGGTLPRINLPAQTQQVGSGKAGQPMGFSVCRGNKIGKALANDSGQRPRSSCAPEAEAEAEVGSRAARAKLQTSSSQVDVSRSGRGNSFKNLGRHFFLGSRDKQSSSQADAAAPKSGAELLAAKTKSISLDQGDIREPLVEPADGPSVATFNIILVGDSFVGKSSFAASFMEGSFVQGLISNCSIDFKTKSYKVDGINYTVNLWDTAGQERFRSITASYFRKADGIILMYDVTDKRSYLNVRNWMSTISDTAAENVAVLLVGNKIDLREEKNKDKCVPHSEGFRLAKEYDIVFLETSVKTGTNLIPSMGRLIRLIAKNNSPEEKDDDTIRLNDKNRSFHCMPKNC